MFASLNNALTSLFVRYTVDEDGQTMAEYGLILALVSIAALVAIGALSGGLQNAFNAVAAQLP